MDMSSYVVIIAIVIAGLAYYAQASIKGKVFCQFLRANLTVVEKSVKLSDKYVIFDNCRYVVNIDRIVLLWWTRGINALFPTFRPYLIYKWDSDQPLDPRTFQNTWATPGARNALTQEDNIKSLMKANQVQYAKKESVLQRWFPIIVIIAIVIVGYMIYQMNGNIATMGNQINIIRDKIP